METLIVSRTRMGAHRCIGGIALIKGGQDASIRLLNPDTASADGSVDGDEKGSWPASAPYGIGEVWDLDFERPPRITAPHVEDRIVRGGRRMHKATPEQLRAYLRKNVRVLRPACCWEGCTSTLFEGRLRSSKPGRGDGTGYAIHEDLPATSTGFWTPDRDLTWDGTKHYRYEAAPTPKIGRLTYKGEPAAVPVIPAGTLVRVSLARWLTFEAGPYPDACWLQLSGWY